MPNRPKKIKRHWKPERKPFEREQSNYRFYNSARWRKVAKIHKELNPICVMCESQGVVSPAQFTDHIVRIKDGGDPFNFENLQSLCQFHHNQKSGREAHGYKQQSNGNM